MKKLFWILGFLFIIFSLFSCSKESLPTAPTIPVKKYPTINNFSINPNSCWYKEDTTTTLSWSVADASKVEIDQGIGIVDLTGSKQVKPIKDTTWTLTATNSDGNSTKQCSFQIKPRAYFILVSWEQKYTSYDCPKADGIIKNDGNTAGYNVMIVFTAFNSANIIIDTANGFPASLNTIGVGISSIFEAVFFDLHRWYQIDHITYEITWLNSSGIRLQQIGRLL